MAFVITSKCLDERYAACVDVCPVDCIHPIEHENKPYMVIDPDVCIDCGVCVPECPIGAIVGSPGEAPADAEVNRKLAPQAIAYEKEHGKAAVRQPNEPPRRSDNKLVKG
ncbi:MAG: ferredoxin family protein [Elusimicrobia bacterium]|nr:ferredoxin family protein [Elusimicrobiota bacterium]